MDHDPILITGCSTGIGRATAVRLAGRGHKVYASARRLESVADLPDCEPLQLDVTDEASMGAAIDDIEAEHGSVGTLVNNAGYAVLGAVETTDLGEARTQFETNFFGMARLTQLVLPAMRTVGRGRIVNISSMGGKFTFPGGAFYHASKHAVEAMSDALRFEVAGLGIEVVVIEPGVIKTPFVDTAIGSVEYSAEDDDPYALFNQDLMLRFDSAYKGTMSRFAAASPETVARVIERSIEARRPRPRYVITAGARYLLFLRRILPDRVWDLLLSTQYARPRTRPETTDPGV